MGYWESVLAIELARLLGNFVKRRKLGTLAGEAGMPRLSPGLVRIPDLSFISRARLAHDRLAHAPILPLAPDLAVEVLSEGNTPREMARKVREYFDAGCGWSGSSIRALGRWLSTAPSPNPSSLQRSKR